MLKPSKGVFRLLHNYVNTLDRFPVTFQFRVGNKNKHGTFLGGMWFIIFVIFSAVFMLKKTKEFFHWSNYTLKFIEKAVYPTPRMNFREMEFNFALQITFENNTSIGNSNYKNLFLSETILRQKKGISLDSEKILKQRPCNSLDFKDSNEDPLFKKTSFSELLCIENVQDLYLYGTHHDEEMAYITNKIKINPVYLADEEALKEIFKNNVFKFRLFFIDALNDVSSLENPIFQKIDSLYAYLDLNFLKKMKIGFQEFQYKEDRNLFMHQFKEKSFFKKFSMQESDVTILDRVNSNLEVKEELIRINLMAHNNVKIVIKTFENLPEFLGEVSANLSNILIWSSILMNIYNQIQTKQYVMSKIMKYNDSETNKKAAQSIHYFTSTFNNRLVEEIKEKMPFIFGLKKEFKAEADKKLIENVDILNKNNLNIITDTTNNNNSNIGILASEKNKDEKKTKKSVFDPKNFLRRETVVNPSLQAGGAALELAAKKKPGDEILITDPKFAQKERLNESLQEDLENPEEVIERQNPNSMGFFDILLYVLCCGNCKDVQKKGIVFENADKIFNKNLDVINYMKKMQEIDIVKYLVLDNETLDLMNFLSKPSVSIGQRLNQDDEYLKFFFPSEKINSINYSNINNLKNSYDMIVKRENHNKVDKRILKLFHIQLQEMNVNK